MHCFTTMVEGQEGGEQTLPAKDQDQKIITVMGEKTWIHNAVGPSSYFNFRRHAPRPPVDVDMLPHAHSEH